MPEPTLFDRLKQRALDVIDLSERLCTMLPRGSSLEEECFQCGVRILRCVSLLDERPCAVWALDELVGRSARLAALFASAAACGFLEPDREAEGITLCEDLTTLVRELRRATAGTHVYRLATSRRPPCLLG